MEARWRQQRQKPPLRRKARKSNYLYFETLWMMADSGKSLSDQHYYAFPLSCGVFNK